MSQGFINSQNIALPIAVGSGGTGATSAGQALTNLGVAQPNVLIGGNFDTNPWQRNITFAGITVGQYTADRWSANLTTTTSVRTDSRATDAPTVAQAGFFVKYSYKVAITTAQASLSAGTFSAVTQRIEGFNFARIAQQSFTLSFWAKHSKAGIYCVGFRNQGFDRSYVAEYTINSANTWEYKTITVSPSPSAGTWTYETGLGLSVDFTIAAGPTYQTTANTWATGNYLATANQVNALDSTSNTFQLALIKIELGTSATPYPLELVQDVLRRCQRYYTKSYLQSYYPGTVNNSGSTSYVTAGTGYGAGTLLNTVPFPVTMRTAPTVTIYSTNSANTGVIYNVSAGGELPSFAANYNDRAYSLQINATMNTNNIFLWHHIADAEL